MRLHVFPHSNNAIEVLATAYHCELPVELVFVDLLKGAQKTAAYTALNPNQRMPVLEDDDFVLWESNAIAQYLAAQCPASGLWPWEPRRQADVARWQFWQAAHWGPKPPATKASAALTVFSGSILAATLAACRTLSACSARAAR